MRIGFARRDVSRPTVCSKACCIALSSLWLIACNTSDTTTAPDLAQWSIGAEPLTSVSADDASGEPQLGEVAGLTRLQNGSLLVADRTRQSLRFFDADGTPTRVVGREGDGPGEFRYIAWARRCGDSLFVEEISRRQIMLYTLDGTLARTASDTELQGGRPTTVPATRTACGCTTVGNHRSMSGLAEHALRSRIGWLRRPEIGSRNSASCRAVNDW